MLVAVAILTVLMAILLPTFTKAKFAANLALCAANQRQIALGLATYALDNRRWFPKNGSYSHKPWNYTHHKNLPALMKPYLGGEGMSDSRWAYDAPVMVCPAGRAESMRNPDSRGHTVVSYFMKFDNTSDSTYGLKNGFPDPDCPTCIGQYTQRRPFNHGPVAEPERMMRKLGQRWILSGQEQEYDIIAGDFCRREQFHTRGIQTNHVIGGSRSYLIHFTPSPLYWGAPAGEGIVNYAVVDGSVKTYRGLTYANLNNNNPTVQQSQHDSSGLWYPRDLARN
jgi:type II secretory pathway pseudopilin PulG